MCIHALKLNDIDDLVRIHKTTFSTEDRWNRTSFLDLLSMNYVGGYAYWEENKIVAFILISLVVDECEILTFCVDPKYQKKGIGSCLMKYLLQHLKQKKFSIFLEVSELNLKAYRFYKKNGFLKIGERKSYYNDGSNAFLMKYHASY